jgi:hypothetical protein
MAFTTLARMAEIATAAVFHGLLTYVGTDKGKIYQIVNSTGVFTELDSVGEKIVALTINHPTLYVTTDKGTVYTYAITASADPYLGDSVGANSNAVGSGVPLTRSGATTAGTRIYSDDGGAALYGSGSVPDIRGSLSRTLLSIDHSGGDIRVHALMGQLKAYNAMWNDEVVSAVHGRLEIVRASGTVTLGGYGVSAGVLSVIESSGAITVDTNHILAGVAALADFKATLTQTGMTVGVYVGKYNTAQWSDATARANWKYGLFVDEDSVDYCPIAVGEFVSSAGTGGGFAVTLANSAAMRIYAEVTADLTSGAMVRSILGRMLVAGNITSTAEAFGVVGQLVVKQAKMQHDNAGVMGSFEVQTTAATVSGDIGDSVCAAVLGRVGVTITGTGVEADGVLAGVAAMSNITDGFVTVTSGGILAAFYAGKFSTKQTWDVGLYIDAAASYAFGFKSGTDNECGVKLASVTGIPDTTAKGTIRFLIGTTAYFIPFHEAGDITGE